MSIRVLIADDHGVVRDGLHALLENHQDITVVGEAEDGENAISHARMLKPDVVVMDISMPGIDGIEASKEIKSENPDIKVIILSMYATDEHLERAWAAGASGYLFKENAGREVAYAIRAVAEGQKYISRGLPLNARPPEEVIEPSPASAALELLSERELQILRFVVEGKSSSKIAEALYLSPKTIETYRSRLMQKLEISDIPSLVKFAIKHGITHV